jgi:hypothetical protein
VSITRITVFLGWVVLVSLGLGSQAGAYFISPAPFYPGFSLTADLTGIPAYGYASLTQYHANMENSQSGNYAASDWTAGLQILPDSWGPGGKTTGFNQRIDVSLQAQLVSGNANVGGMCLTNEFFNFQPESAWTATPFPVDITVSWGGETSGASASVALNKIEGLFNIVEIIPMTMIYLTGQGTVTLHASLPQPANNYDLSIYLADEQNWATPGNYASDMWIEVTLSATEAGLTPPAHAAPIPGSLVLLGSGLASLWAKANWRKLIKRGLPLIGPLKTG